MTVVTVDAAAVVGDPPQLVERETRTFAGEIPPEGKPDPVTLTVEVPAVPELGLVAALSFTVDWA
jgi:hypothetical protein